MRGAGGLRAEPGGAALTHGGALHGGRVAAGRRGRGEGGGERAEPAELPLARAAPGAGHACGAWRLLASGGLRAGRSVRAAAAV